MALLFLNAWGCEVTAFSTNPKKEKEARKFGAHHFINSNNTKNLNSLANKFKMILVTANVEIDWDAYINTLAPGGRLHIVGAVPQVRATMSPLISHEESIGASPTGGPAVILSMLNFCTRNQIMPLVEEYPLSKVNEALEHLEAGKARYRIILRNNLT